MFLLASPISVTKIIIQHRIKLNCLLHESMNGNTFLLSSFLLLQDSGWLEEDGDFIHGAFVHLVAVIYVIFCVLSLVPNIAVVIRLNNSMYKTIQRTFSLKSNSQIGSTTETNYRYSLLIDIKIFLTVCKLGIAVYRDCYINYRDKLLSLVIYSCYS